MSNAITLNEPQVNVMMATYVGVQLERASSQSGGFVLVVRLPYVTNQTTYAYLDAAGAPTDWYRTTRYASDGTFGPYSAAWAVTAPPHTGCTLAELEREVARRIGPYLSAFTDRQLPNTAQFTFATLPQLRSTIDLDSVTNLWLLRRGITRDGVPVALDVVDRQALVTSYDPETGRVYPDRPWGTIPVPGEVFEFHHFDPEQELRVAVMAGLRRCFIPDLVQAQSTAPYGGIDLTAQYPWLIDPWQVTQVQYGWVQPCGDAPSEAVSQGGHVWLMGAGYWAAPVSVWVSAWRPASSWVNGAESFTGPTNDGDLLDVDIDYAAAAGHIEAWHHFPPRMMAAAAGGMQATQAMAAQEFSRQAILYGPQRSTTVGFRSTRGLRPTGMSWGHSRTWVNR